MADNTEKTNSTGKASGDPEEQNVTTIGGPTAQAMGTEYQMESTAGADTAKAIQSAGSVSHSGQAAGAPHDADAGREPEEYYEKQSAGSTGGDLVDVQPDIQGYVGRQRIQHPTPEQHGEAGD